MQEFGSFRDTVIIGALYKHMDKKPGPLKELAIVCSLFVFVCVCVCFFGFVFVSLVDLCLHIMLFSLCSLRCQCRKSVHQ